MEEVKIFTHFIITEMYEEYHMNWTGKITNIKPKFKNDKLLFSIVGTKGRMEVNTNDMRYLEDCAKALTLPKGRKAITSDAARIFIIGEDDKETLIGILIHNHIKKYAPMYDSVGYTF